MRPYLHPPGSNAFSVLRNSHPRSSTKTAKSLLASALRRPFALLMILLLLPFAVPELYAQQPWPQTPQYTYGQRAQSAPSAGQYAPNPGSSHPANPQPPLYYQPTGSPPQTYGQQPYTGQPEYAADQAYPAPDYDQPQASPQAPAQPFTPEQLQQLVAPIALYPDNLVAQILAAATYPDQVVEADRWLQQHTDLKGEQLGKEVDKQPWDPSVKALVEFPSVLANMDKNLSWTSSLGNAYVNQQQDVMNAVQVMHDRAEKVGN